MSDKVQPNSDALAYITDQISDEAQPDERTQVYDYVRDNAPQLGLVRSEYDNLERLRIEKAIAQLEAKFVRSQSKDDETTSVWSIFDKKSPHYALHPAENLSETTQQIFSNKHTRPTFWPFKVWSLWLQSTHRDGTMDRLGYLWLLLDPMIHVLIICAIPFFLHSDTVNDMPVLPFGIIGACFLMTFRMASVGAISGGGALTPQLDHPVVSRFDIICARAFHSLAIYTFIGTILMSATIISGKGDLPENLAVTLCLLILNWCMGFAYGTTVHALIGLYAGFRRINGFVTRFIALSAGTFYISEQLPETMKTIVLLNPLLHSVQFARSFWFYEYDTSDASAIYLFFSSLIILSVGLASHFVSRGKIEVIKA